MRISQTVSPPVLSQRKRGRSQLLGYIGPGLPPMPRSGSYTHRPPDVSALGSAASKAAISSALMAAPFAGTSMIGSMSKAQPVTQPKPGTLPSPGGGCTKPPPPSPAGGWLPPPVPPPPITALPPPSPLLAEQLTIRIQV